MNTNWEGKSGWVGVIHCIKKTADEWIENAVKYGDSKDNYLYEDETLWRKKKPTTTSIIVNQTEEIEVHGGLFDF